MNLEALGGRKFLLTLLTLAVGTAVQILSPHGVTTEFAALLVGLTTAFGAANALITSATSQPVAAAGETTPQPVDLGPLEGKVSSLYEAVSIQSRQLEQTEGNVAALNGALAKVAETADLAAKAAKAALTR